MDGVLAAATCTTSRISKQRRSSSRRKHCVLTSCTHDRTTTYLTPTSVYSLAEALLLVLGGLRGFLLRLLLRRGLAGVLGLLGLSVRRRKRALLVGGDQPLHLACGTSARARAENRGYA